MACNLAATLVYGVLPRLSNTAGSYAAKSRAVLGDSRSACHGFGVACPSKFLSSSSFCPDLTSYLGL